MDSYRIHNPSICYICGQEATHACDYSAGTIITLCPREMCEKHAIQVDIDTHVCQEHSSELHKRKAQHIRMELVERMGWSIPMENCDGDGI